ncbi:hypothetical protein PIB30_088795 [Stylosanthes scabra]|uniref:Uncharacterized protein n=1 Tax=Stylosanthes scabra TaxID=79078 RepID=A0ABU6QTS0_9FABA|nr:hypothetical protein [Stylosanthes scabra]
MARGGQRQAAGRGRQQLAGRERGQTAGRGQRRPAMRSPDINRFTETTHMIGAQVFQVPRLLELRRSSLIVAPPPAILPYIREADFEGPLMLRDFDIDGPLFSSFVEC